jgi:SM-20-related protein
VDRPELNPGIDATALAEAFARSQCIQIPAVLTTASAERLLHVLAEETPWVLTHNIDGTRRQIPNPAPAERMTLALESRQRARDHFAFFYDGHQLSQDGEAYARPGHAFAGLVAFLNGPEFLGFIRRVTGMEIGMADAEATLFRPGDYLTRQDGMAEGKNRRAGYMLSMTPAWRLDWGGALEFVGPTGHVAKGYVPTFNTLTVFAVPSLHFVSQVALHGGLRYAVSGWLRSARR